MKDISFLLVIFFIYIQIQQWCKEAGEGVTYEFEQRNPNVECTKTDSTNPYWVAFKAAADEMYVIIYNLSIVLIYLL